MRGRVHQVRGKGGSAFMVLRQEGAYTVQALHFKDKTNPEVSKRCVLGWPGQRGVMVCTYAEESCI